MSSYKIISLRAQINGFKQRDVKSAGTFNSYEKACQVADKMNKEANRIYTTYSAQKVYNTAHLFTSKKLEFSIMVRNRVK